MTEDELVAAYQARLRRGDLPPGAPDPEAIQRVAAGRAGEAERLRVLDVVMQSESLRREFELFRALAAAESPRRAPRLPRQLLALAAAILVMVMAGSLWWQRHPAGPEPARGGASGVSLLTPAPGARVSPPVTLQWAGVPGASSYSVEVLAADGSVLFDAAGTDTQVVLPGSVPISAGESYVWRVVATVTDGRRVESEPRRFSAAP